MRIFPPCQKGDFISSKQREERNLKATVHKIEGNTHLFPVCGGKLIPNLEAAASFYNLHILMFTIGFTICISDKPLCLKYLNTYTKTVNVLDSGHAMLLTVQQTR